MRKATIEIELFEKGDRVLLPDGEALVQADEKIDIVGERFKWGELRIKWLNESSKHRAGQVEFVNRNLAMFIK